MRKLWKPVKEALWKRKTKDNAKHDRTGNFHSTDSVLWEPAHISHDKVIGGIVDSGTRNKWEDPGEQEHRDRSSAHCRKNPCNQCQCKGGDQVCDGIVCVIL